MKKIFTDNIKDGFCVLTGDNHNHLSHVLRSRVGDKIILCRNSVDYECVIEKIDKKETLLKVLSFRECVKDTDIEVTLYFALMKGDKNELVAQKCTELGITRLCPFVSSNCECRPDNFKKERINKIITEAAQQCGRSSLPLVDEVISFSDMLNSIGDYEIVVFPYEKAEDVTLKQVLQGVDHGSRIAVVVGSEGGFTKDEAEMLKGKGVRPVTLGKRILRAETASIAVVSAIMYEGNQWKIN